MDNDKTKIYCLFAVSIILALFGAACFYMCFTGEFDADIGHFTREALFAPIMYVCLAAGAVCGVVAWILFYHCETEASATVGDPTFHFASGVLCAASIFAALISDCASFFQNAKAWDGVPAPMHYALWILGAAAGVCMAICSVPKYFSLSVRSPAGFAPPLFLAARILLLYFNRLAAVNSPAMLLPQLAAICFMLALTAEVGINVQRGYIFPRWMFTLCLSTAAGGTLGLGMLLVIAGGGTIPTVNIFDALFFTVLFARSAEKLLFIKNAEIKKTMKKDRSENAAEQS